MDYSYLYGAMLDLWGTYICCTKCSNTDLDKTFLFSSPSSFFVKIMLKISINTHFRFFTVKKNITDIFLRELKNM